jgi:chemotaxis protein MotB
MRKKLFEEETNFWISFSDLMAGMLIIFILLFIFKLYDVQGSKEETLEIQQENQQLQEKLKSAKAKVVELTSTRLKIITLLKEKFDEAGIKIYMDSKTGTIELREGVLFDRSKSNITVEGEEFLEHFIPIYLEILLDNEEINSKISEIIIEGHTDNVGEYIYNLNLSQSRATSVLSFLMNDNFPYQNKEKMIEFVSAKGKSYSNLIYDENGKVNKSASRRVEFKFRLKEEKLLLEIKEELEKGD